MKAQNIEQLMTFLKGSQAATLDTDEFVRLIFNRFWMGSFPMARIR